MTKNTSHSQLLFSADSHVIENPGLWADLVPDGFFNKGSFRSFALDAEDVNEKTTRVEAEARLIEVAKDNVFGEVLYPTFGLKIFGLEDRSTQEACCERYNDWLSIYCGVAPEKLIGIGMISAYDIDTAIKQARSCKAAGLKGVVLWQTPPPDLPFSGLHYDRLWAELESLEMPVSLHILSGFNYSRKREDLSLRTDLSAGERAYLVHRPNISLKLLAAADAVLEFIFSGVFDRFPKLRMIIVENEIGWLPFLLDQSDYYYSGKSTAQSGGLIKQPSEYYGTQLFATFFRDPYGTQLLDVWGSDGSMWSNDYPHANSTWPNSLEVANRLLGHLPKDIQEKVVRTNVIQLYNLE